MNEQERKLQKRVEQAEYRAKQSDNELNAIRSSKAFRVAKAAGVMKNRLRSDPVGLTRKVAATLLNDPQKLLHVFRSANRVSVMAQSFNDQNVKYQEWILLNEPDEAELAEQRKASANFAYAPLISFLTPVFNPPVDVLEELIESVLEQTYPNFELLLGDFGTSAEVSALITKYASIDHRIKALTFTDNQGIAGNSNQILEKVSGDFVALLDHDDTVSPDALYENVLRLNEADYDFIYSDKDKIDEKGTRFDPLFKAKLSPEMLLNINYLTHLNLMRTTVVREIGGWDSDTDGAQDWDLFLRFIARSDKVCHVPKILYHWRVLSTSTALSIETKPYALAGQRRAIDKYLAQKGVRATSYHQHTELFLKWDDGALDTQPTVFVWHSSDANSLRIVRHVKRIVPQARFVVLVRGATTPAHINGTPNTTVAYYGDGTPLAATIDAALSRGSGECVLFIDDTVHLPKKTDWYENLTGWLALDGVDAASGRLVDKYDLIVDSGSLISKDGDIFPLFFRYPRFYQSYIGNAEWVRDLSVVSPRLFTTKREVLSIFARSDRDGDEQFFERYTFGLSHGGRVVMTPHVTALTHSEDITGRPYPFAALQKGSDFHDPYGNVNLSSADPTRLFADEALAGIDEKAGEAEPLDSYGHDAVILAQTFDITADEIAKNRAAARTPLPHAPKSVAWFLPSYDAVYAGLTNIFSFARFLQDKGMQTTVYVLSGQDSVDGEKALAVAAFPELARARFLPLHPDQAHTVGHYDIAVATLWSTAYALARVPSIGRKCYFIQDNETNFYPKGSVSALVSLSYQFGFTAIANTPGLLDMYRTQYGGDGVVAKSLVDLSAYHPRDDRYYTPVKPYKVFFYARPKMPRNAFELGIAGLKKLKADLGDDVEIITAGANWDEAAYGVEGLFTNLGKIAYDAVPKLYRLVDAGLMFMFSGHPGVTASELMASGCPVVVNDYDDVSWHELYVHEKTCLVTLPTASEVARNLTRCLTEADLRRTLIEEGLKKVSSFYDGYAKSLERAYQELTER